MTITTGRTVLYTLSDTDAEAVNRRRTSGSSIAERIKRQVLAAAETADQNSERIVGGTVPQWPLGAQAHIGNPASAGDVVPLVVVRVWPNEYGEGVPGVNGQAFLDGNDALWITSAREGTEPGTWAWPPRV